MRKQKINNRSSYRAMALSLCAVLLAGCESTDLTSLSGKGNDLMSHFAQDLNVSELPAPQESAAPAIDPEQLAVLEFVREISQGTYATNMHGTTYKVVSSYQSAGGAWCKETLVSSKGSYGQRRLLACYTQTKAFIVPSLDR